MQTGHLLQGHLYKLTVNYQPHEHIFPQTKVFEGQCISKRDNSTMISKDQSLSKEY